MIIAHSIPLSSVREQKHYLIFFVLYLSLCQKSTWILNFNILKFPQSFTRGRDEGSCYLSRKVVTLTCQFPIYCWPQRQLKCLHPQIVDREWGGGLRREKSQQRRSIHRSEVRWWWNYKYFNRMNRNFWTTVKPDD